MCVRGAIGGVGVGCSERSGDSGVGLCMEGNKCHVKAFLLGFPAWLNIWGSNPKFTHPPTQGEGAFYCLLGLLSQS